MGAWVEMLRGGQRVGARMRRTPWIVSLSLVLLSGVVVAQKDRSGPQVGEVLPKFTMRGVLDDEAGKSIDLVQDAAGRPLVLFFLHERTRPSVALARQVLSEAANHKAEGVEAGLVLLTADVPMMEDWVKMVPQVLPRGVSIGISPDGPQGPAAYSLNPKVVATVIIAKDNRVVANFGLSQPSLAEDGPKIEAAIGAVLEKAKP